MPLGSDTEHSSHDPSAASDKTGIFDLGIAEHPDKLSIFKVHTYEVLQSQRLLLSTQLSLPTTLNYRINIGECDIPKSTDIKKNLLYM